MAYRIYGELWFFSENSWTHKPRKNFCLSNIFVLCKFCTLLWSWPNRYNWPFQRSWQNRYNKSWKYPTWKDFKERLEKTENETHLNQPWCPFAIHNCEELQNWDINDAFALINGLLSKALSTFLPKTEKSNLKRKKNKGWITNNIKIASAKKMRFYKAFYFRRTQNSWECHKNQQNKVKKVVDESKTFYQNLFNDTLWQNSDFSRSWKNFSILEIITSSVWIT